MGIDKALEWLGKGNNMKLFVDFLFCMSPGHGDHAKCLPFSLDYMGEKAREYGMSRLAKETGFSREHLYRALRNGSNPTMVLILKVDEVLGLGMHVVPKDRP